MTKIVVLLWSQKPIWIRRMSIRPRPLILQQLILLFLSQQHEQCLDRFAHFVIGESNFRPALLILGVENLHTHYSTDTDSITVSDSQRKCLEQQGNGLLLIL